MVIFDQQKQKAVTDEASSADSLLAFLIIAIGATQGYSDSKMCWEVEKSVQETCLKRVRNSIFLVVNK